MYKVKHNFFRLRNLFLATFLAAAGIFSTSAIIANKQVEETPVVEEAKAASSDTTFSGVSGDILYVKGNQSTYFPGSYYCTMHLWGGNSSTASDNNIYVCNNNYSVYNDGSNYYYALRVPFDSSGNSVTYTSLQICRQTPSGAGNYDNYTGDINISTALEAIPTNLVEWTGWGTYSISSTTYTHYGIASGDHVYIDISACPSWAINPDDTDNKVTIFLNSYAFSSSVTYDAYIYLWTDGGAANASWPGEKVSSCGTFVYDNEYSQPIYLLTIDLSIYNKMIINGGSGNPQTADYSLSTSDRGVGFLLNGDNKSTVSTWSVDSKYYSDANIGVYFAVSDTSSGDGWSSYRNGSDYSTSYARVVEGQDNDYLYEVLAPQLNGVDVIWNLVIVGRFDSTSSAPAWDDIWTQKSDFYYTSALSSYNEFKITGWGSNDYTCSDTISNETRVAYYSDYFLEQTGYACKQIGSTDIDELDTYWTNCSNEYKKYLSKEVQYLFWEAEAGDTSTTLGSAVTRYDYIQFFKEYSLTAGDYANRTTSEGKKTTGAISSFSPFTIMESEDNMSTVIIIIAASVSLLSLTALSVLIIKKKKTVNK